jgi:hypothetical protein
LPRSLEGRAVNVLPGRLFANARSNRKEPQNTGFLINLLRSKLLLRRSHERSRTTTLMLWCEPSHSRKFQTR